MKILLTVLILSIDCYGVYGNSMKTEDDYNLLPPLFNLDATEEHPVGHMFCKVRISLSPIDERNSSRTWKIIEQTQRNDNCFNRNEVYYATSAQKIGDLELSNLSEKYEKYGLTPKIKKMYCNKIQTFFEFVKVRDIILLGILSCYIVFVIYCSVRTRMKKEISSQRKMEKYIEIFAIQNTWRNILKTNRNEDFQNLLCIQGVRTITITLVVVLHSYMSYLFIFLDNPEYLENIFLKQEFFTGCFGLVVQSFFLMSSWLLAVQLHNSVKKNGYVTGKEIINMAVKRYFRLVPTVVVVLVLHSSTVTIGTLIPPIYSSISRVEQQICERNWWKNLLFIQNISDYAEEMCMTESWYLAADTQMYFLTLLLFYLSQKIKFDIKYLFAVTVGIGLVFQVYTLVTTDFDGLMRFNPKIFPAEDSRTSPEFLMSYGRTICNLPTYAIGFTAGTIYSKNKTREIFNTRMKKIYWFIAFMGLPLLTSFMYTKRISRVIEVLMAVSLRPLYSLGIGIGILGMATNTGGIIKEIFECRPLVLLGNFAYSIYMFNFLVLMGRILNGPIFVHMTIQTWIINIITDVISCFAVGILMYLVLEGPFLQLQKVFLSSSSIRKKTEETC